MTKDEKVQNALRKAQFLAQQNRWPEAKLAYENIIADLRGKPRPGQKTKGLYK